MCYSAEASFGAAAALIPTGAYCVAAAWRKDRNYLPLAVVPVLFGLQQFCEGLVWVGLDRANPEMVRFAALGYLLFALAVWPTWVPLAVAAIEPRGRKRSVFVALSGVGLMLAIAYFMPVLTESGRGLNPAVVGHSIRYDVSSEALAGVKWWWVWPILYLAAVSGPLLGSRERALRPLGVAVALSAITVYAFYEYVFASVWCLFAALLSLQLAYVLFRLPESSTEKVEPKLHCVL